MQGNGKREQLVQRLLLGNQLEHWKPDQGKMAHSDHRAECKLAH